MVFSELDGISTLKAFNFLSSQFLIVQTSTPCNRSDQRWLFMKRVFVDVVTGQQFAAFKKSSLAISMRHLNSCNGSHRRSVVGSVLAY